jgi:hypothetical protein
VRHIEPVCDRGPTTRRCMVSGAGHPVAGPREFPGLDSTLAAEGLRRPTERFEEGKRVRTHPNCRCTGQRKRERTVPSVDLASVPAFIARPAVVAITHLPIVLVALLSAPIWLLAAIRPASHGESALKLVRELRMWSRDAVAGAMRAR